jgi:hypothetical protein
MNSKIAAFQITRRGIASAILTGQTLSFWEARSLSSNYEQACSSITAFVNWTLGHFKIDSAALEAFGPEDKHRTARLARFTTDLLHGLGIPVLTAQKSEVLSAFASPAIRTKGELRKIITALYPQFATYRGSNVPLDAAALGLYFQTERLLATKANHELTIKHLNP